MHPGDTLVVPCLDRLSPSLQDLVTTVGELRGRGVGFTSLHENLDTTTPGGRLVFHVFAEFIRALIVSGTREGLAAARARGRVGGRPSVVTPEMIRAARDMLPNPDASITSIARLLGVSPGTLYHHVPDLRQLRATGRADTARRPRRPRNMTVTRAVKTLVITLIVVTGLLTFHPPHFLLEAGRHPGSGGAVLLEIGLAVNLAAAVLAAVGIGRNARWGWILGIVMAVTAIGLCVVQQTVGLPGLPKNWAEPSRIVSLAVQAVFITVAVGALSDSRS